MEFDVNVQEALDTSEDRIQRGPRCLYNMKFGVVTVDVDETAYLHRFLDTLENYPVGCPVWFDAMKLDQPRSAGTITLTTDHMENSLVDIATHYLLWRDFETWEVVQAASTNQGSNLITTDTVLANSWAAGDLLVPLLFGYMKRDSVAQPTDIQGNFEVKFEERWHGLSSQATGESTVTTDSTPAASKLWELATGFPGSEETPIPLHVLAGLPYAHILLPMEFLKLYELSGVAQLVVTSTAISGTDQYGFQAFQTMDEGGPQIVAKPINLD
jgi:hypothetical protein